TRADLASREYQLEELEDREECETEVWLNADGSVTLGPSNGPKVAEYEGDWHLLETAGEEDRPFRMRLTRRYESPSSVKSNAGDTTYSVKREFWGNVEMVGESVAVTGRTHGNPDPAEENPELGYFALIDAASSEGVEGERSST
ncbi:hypothetical protein ACHAWF_008125, partial [Thalassiosira exigua]